MSHTIARTADGSQDTCLTCGMTGDLSQPCPQPKEPEKKTTTRKKK